MSEHDAHEGRDLYRLLFNSIDQGFCLCEMLLDENGRPYDYRFLEVNRTFDEHTGLKDAQGRAAIELLPELEPHWIETCGRVALTGTPVRFEQVSAVMGRWFDVYAFPVAAGGSRRFVLFSDITARKRNDEVFRRTRAQLESALEAGLARTFYWDIDTDRVITDEKT